MAFVQVSKKPAVSPVPDSNAKQDAVIAPPNLQKPAAEPSEPVSAPVPAKRASIKGRPISMRLEGLLAGGPAPKPRPLSGDTLTTPYACFISH